MARACTPCSAAFLYLFEKRRNVCRYDIPRWLQLIETLLFDEVLRYHSVRTVLTAMFLRKHSASVASRSSIRRAAWWSFSLLTMSLFAENRICATCTEQPSFSLMSLRTTSPFNQLDSPCAVATGQKRKIGFVALDFAVTRPAIYSPLRTPHPATSWLLRTWSGGGLGPWALGAGGGCCLVAGACFSTFRYA